MAAHGARRLGRMCDNLEVILGVELMCAAQGVEFRAPLGTSSRLAAVVARLRSVVPALGQDRYMAPEIERATDLIRSGAVCEAAGATLTLEET